MNKYLYSDLTEKIIGSLFEVFNELQFGYREKAYQNGLAYKFEDKGITYKREQYTLIKMSGKPVARHFADFVIEDKVVVELKVANDFYSTHVQQLLSYLESEHKRVGLLCIISSKGVKIKRFIK